MVTQQCTQGEVDIFNGRSEHVATLTEGSIFGEVAFFNSSKRMATVKARTWYPYLPSLPIRMP